jgi:uncharacterized repeat protein (TIGR01451 family)
MSRRLPVLAFLVALLLPVSSATAEMRLTDVNGQEVVIRRGPMPRKPPKVTADALRPRVITNAVVASGPDTDAANNDYRRIQNALNAATSGDVITLSGTFDFTAPFAAAAWALGNDGVAATGDDYEVLVPPGLNNVTLTAASLGSATIQGPGDLAGINLEAFLVFDASLSGASQGWTISNLRILDFDLSIGMFAVAATDYNNTTISNNFIRIPTDLNAVAAPADVNQNIGLHVSFGTNQSVLNNLIHINGDGVSNGANTSSDVGLQTNTGVGSTYDGFQITGNTLHIINAQSAAPEVVLGFWENGHAHTSDITIQNNAFTNDAGGNSPSLNMQRGFRITSHSGAATTVAYTDNSVSGANIGYQWITAANFAGNQAVLMTGDQALNCDTGILVQSDGLAHIDTATITGSGAGGGVHVVTGTLTGAGADPNGISHSFVSGGSGDGVWIEATAGAIAPISLNDLGGHAGVGLRNDSVPTVLAERNWWGSNLAAAVAAEAAGNVDSDPWLASGTDTSPGSPGFQPFFYATTTGTLTTLNGTGVADTGLLRTSFPAAEMQLNGITGFTAIEELLNIDVQLADGDDVFAIGQGLVLATFNGGIGTDTLVGTNTVSQTWNITGAGSGNIPGAVSLFTNVESLRGTATSADSFVFNPSGSLAGSIDGDLGFDSLDNNAIPASTVTPTGPGTLDGQMGTATGIGTTFDNINLIVPLPADLSITKTGPATAAPGSQFTYTITVANSGPNSATNVVVSDTLPAGVSFVSAIPSQGSCAGTTTVTCTLGTINNGSNATISLTVQVTAATGTIVNTATVTATEPDPSPGNTSSTATTSISAVAAIPTAGVWGLLALMAMLGAIAVRRT